MTRRNINLFHKGHRDKKFIETLQQFAKVSEAYQLLLHNTLRELKELEEKNKKYQASLTKSMIAADFSYYADTIKELEEELHKYK